MNKNDINLIIGLGILIIIALIIIVIVTYYRENPVRIRNNKFRIVKNYRNKIRFQKRYFPGIWIDVTGRDIESDIDIFPSFFPENYYTEEGCIEFLDKLKKKAEETPRKRVIVERTIRDYTGTKSPIKEKKEDSL